jgi:hypothetical protein
LEGSQPRESYAKTKRLITRFCDQTVVITRRSISKWENRYCFGMKPFPLKILVKKGKGYPGPTDGPREFLDTPSFVFAEALGLSNDSFNKTRSARKVLLIYHFWLL